ncbi:hypothetical protein E0I61_09700 [Flavobacterium ranwuense]|uniref:Metallo-beta-lactamase domain-containing protein n=1 Tax=Flavobacterium ranwuense TaxID=2541725 RepID=A0ABY2DSK5_9FLAO|nr:hypothetical protein [Flavobacterium ranwuense]TDE29421.1 hypothetical protein E0I61_09700 [Flavobacterium ranwuense]
MKKIIYNSLLIVSLFWLTTSCEEDLSNDSINLAEALKQVGGEINISNFNTLSYRINGASYEWEESTITMPNPINTSNYIFDYIEEVNSRKCKLIYNNLEIKQPFDYNSNSAIITINDKHGSISGKYDFKSHFFNQTSAIPIYSSKIEAILKNQKLANPIGLLKQAITLGLKVNENTLLIPTRIQGLNIELLFDSSTKLPKCARIKEDDYLYGDVYFEVKYENWSDISNIKFPKKLTYLLNDKVLKIETISNLIINPLITSDYFNITIANPIVFNEQNADFGYLHSQWYNRWIVRGLIFDQPLNSGAMILEDFDLSIYGIQNQHVGDNVKIIGRPDHSIYGVVIKTNDGLVIFESPLNNIWTRSIINTAKSKFPGIPVIAGISSHSHGATLSGIRETAYECGKIYTAQNGVGKLTSVINAIHNIHPDALSLNPRAVSIESVNNIVNLSGGEIQIHPLKTFFESNSLSGQHSDDMLIVYVPEYHLIIQSEMLWMGSFYRVWNGQAFNSYTPSTKSELKRRAKYLLDYINEKNLNVDKIISIQGGLGSMNDLLNVINN